MYSLDFDEEAIQFLEKQEQLIKERIFQKIQKTKENPHRYFERLEGRMDYKLRVGDYRVIADIDDTVKNIQVTLIGHRKDIYKKLPKESVS